MANYPKYNLTGKAPSDTYKSLAQFNNESSSLLDGNGNDITSSVNFTAIGSTGTLSVNTLGGNLVLNQGFGGVLIQSHANPGTAQLMINTLSASLHAGESTHGIIQFNSTLQDKSQFVVSAIVSDMFVASDNTTTGSALSVFMPLVNDQNTYIERQRIQSDGNIIFTGSVSSLFGGFTGSLLGTAVTVGLTATKSFIDNSHVTQSIFIQNGLIINWTSV